MGVVQVFEVRVRKSAVRDVESDLIPGLRVDIEGAGHSFIGVLVPTHPVRRVNVERGEHPAVRQVLKERFGVGEQLFVPRVTRPACPQVLIDVD